MSFNYSFIHPFIHLFERLIFQSIEPNQTYTDGTQFISLQHCDVQISATKSLATKKETFSGRWAFSVYKTCLCMTDWMNMSFNVNLCPGLKPPNSFLTPVSVIGSVFHIKLKLNHLLCWQNGCTVVINLFWSWYACSVFVWISVKNLYFVLLENSIPEMLCFAAYDQSNGLNDLWCIYSHTDIYMLVKVTMFMLPITQHTQVVLHIQYKFGSF